MSKTIDCCHLNAFTANTKHSCSSQNYSHTEIWPSWLLWFLWLFYPIKVLYWFFLIMSYNRFIILTYEGIIHIPVSRYGSFLCTLLWMWPSCDGAWARRCFSSPASSTESQHPQPVSTVPTSSSCTCHGAAW